MEISEKKSVATIVANPNGGSTRNYYQTLTWGLKYRAMAFLHNVERFQFSEEGRILVESSTRTYGGSSNYKESVTQLSWEDSLGIKEPVYLYLEENGHSKGIDALIASDNATAVEQTFAAIRDAITLADLTGQNQTDVEFWCDTRNGPLNRVRRIDTPPWEEIRGNYSSAVCHEYDRTLEMISKPEAGRIIVWQGQAGTGKTYLLRALMQTLKDHYSVKYIVDPEMFFNANPNYMMSVLFNDNQERTLLVLEDTGEMLKAEASAREGQGLSRLLNLTDGVIGQGLDLRILLTTNEEINTLHKAVTRDGRCLSVLQFEALPVGEANQWLAHNGLDERVNEPATLAELYAIKGGYRQKDRERNDFRAGAYV